MYPFDPPDNLNGPKKLRKMFVVVSSLYALKGPHQIVKTVKEDRGKGICWFAYLKEECVASRFTQKARTMTVAVIDDVDSTYSYIEEQISTTSSSFTRSPPSKKVQGKKGLNKA